jgi:hypothetical protein
MAMIDTLIAEQLKRLAACLAARDGNKEADASMVYSILMGFHILAIAVLAQGL